MIFSPSSRYHRMYNRWREGASVVSMKISAWRRCVDKEPKGSTSSNLRNARMAFKLSPNFSAFVRGLGVAATEVNIYHLMYRTPAGIGYIELIVIIMAFTYRNGGNNQLKASAGAWPMVANESAVAPASPPIFFSNQQQIIHRRNVPSSGAGGALAASRIT